MDKGLWEATCMETTNKLIISMHENLMNADVTQGIEVFIENCEIWLNLLFVEEQKIKTWTQSREKVVDIVNAKTYHHCKYAVHILVKAIRVYEDCEKREAKYGLVLATKRIKRLADNLRYAEKPVANDYNQLITVMEHCEELILTLIDYTELVWNLLRKMEELILKYNEHSISTLKSRTQQQRNGLEMLEEELSLLNLRAHKTNTSNEDLLQDMHDILDVTKAMTHQVHAKS